MPQTEIISQIGFAQLSDLPCLKMHSGEASAVVSLYGGQVLSYQPTAGNELLWLSDKAQWHNGAAIRGGVPVCWPWFGPANSKINPQQQPLPNHGLVRNRLWQLQHSEITANATSVTMGIALNDIPVALWQNPSLSQQTVYLSLTVTLSASQLTMQLSCATPLFQQAALHSYFRVNQLEKSRVTGLSKHYFDKASNTEQTAASSEAHFSAETDRVYYKTASQLQLTDNGQQLIIGQQGHDASVIWNPWQQKSRELPDMADHGFREFVCVETASLDICAARALNLTQYLS